MGDTYGSLTRREILKRGAIVGGGVLWVTPVVQTIGMGTASAQAVSGPDPCAMKPELRDCRPSSTAPWISAEFWVYVPDECRCGNLPWYEKLMIAVDGHTATSMNSAGSSKPGWYWKWIGVQQGSVVTVRCIHDSTKKVIAEGEPFLVDSTVAARCLP